MKTVEQRREEARAPRCQKARSRPRRRWKTRNKAEIASSTSVKTNHVMQVSEFIKNAAPSHAVRICERLR
ncbi:MAG: hypothetical protein H0V27_03330 [Pyrinomonadaceae bacterium]|nr:hypothetical protein [Pyrinomonadaceae bacterium]